MIIAGRINSLPEWFSKAPPKKGRKQWKNGHSAEEFAKLWFRKRKNQAEIPNELLVLIKKRFPDILFKFAIPEYITKIDSFAGGQRNHDLCLFGSSNNEDVVICIEAKATEILGRTIGQELYSVKNNKSSNLPKRINNLSKTIFNVIPENKPGLKDIRYQLLTGIYGTLVEGYLRMARKAMFIVYQICTNLVSKHTVEKNFSDIQRFLGYIPNVNSRQFEKEEPVGPIDYLVPEEYRNRKDKPSLYFGYVKTNS